MAMPHYPSEIILISGFGAQETFLIISVESSCAAQYFCDNRDALFQDSLMNRKFKRIEQNLFKMEIFCSIIKVFRVTFDLMHPC